MIVVAAYDVRADERRSRIAATLQAWGDRIQKSVFVLDISSEDLDELCSRIGAVMDPDEDSFYVFTQCGTCWSSTRCIGQANKPEQTLYWLAL
ncbi:CRISPR-associated endonuclease Cas2 [Ornithinimicrobium avium]|nr:CRISPR-associated endonuclease Cas2 [Ornithinimicrobium avium]